MIIRVKPKIDNKLKKLFDRLLATTDKTLPLHLKFLKNLTPELRDLFMDYFSYTTKYDLKEYNLMKQRFKNNEKFGSLTDDRRKEKWYNSGIIFLK